MDNRMITDRERAEPIIRQYQDEMVSVIIRHGDIAEDKGFSVAPGDTCPLHRLKDGDVVATVTRVEVAEYRSILRDDWTKANYRHGDGFTERQWVDPDLKDTDKATVIEIDLASLAYRPR